MTTQPVLRPVLAAGTLAAYVATIPAANLLVTRVGAQPVGFGFLAPAGVYMVGLALVLRDAAREFAGRAAVVAAIVAGAVLSYLLADPRLAVASAAAFAVSEAADFAVYEPLRSRGLPVAMAASNTVGLLADSLLFLWLAFGSLQYLPGQLLGKTWMTLAAIVVLALWRRPDNLRPDGTCTCRVKAACGHCRHDRCEECGDCTLEGCVCRCEREARLAAADSEATP